MSDYQPPAEADEPPADRVDLFIGVGVVIAVILGLLWAAGVIRLPGA